MLNINRVYSILLLRRNGEDLSI